ncbi:adenylate/guanylate cyclase domain-containing protein, partial [Candidatus Acetothermia bacterium]|nr:adenylate/guanylate cyclase domain-containing protein [Candidatus Acetothermia bacterium]
MEQRRLAAIMFTDIVGYTALTQKNEALSMELLEEHNQILRAISPKYGGREIKTVGDSFHLEFPSALDAVRCAIEMQKALVEHNASAPADRRFQIRIGIHVGDVMPREQDVFGDTVNIAKRLESLAEPGGICISEDIAHQIQNKIEAPLVKLGQAELKNVEEPREIYRVVLPWEKQEVADAELSRPRRKRAWASAGALAAIVVVAMA